MNGITYLNSEVGDITVNIFNSVEMTDRYREQLSSCRKRFPGSNESKIFLTGRS